MMKLNKKTVFKSIAAIIALSSCSMAYAADKKENDGQDPTRPLTRFDIRAMHIDGIPIEGQKDADTNIVLGRIDKPIPLDNGWVFYWRTDVPMVSNDVPSADNPNRDEEWGMGDWFNQFIMIAPGGAYPLGIQTFGIGAQIKLDTASQDQFGAGVNRFVPLVAWKWQIGKNLQIIPVFKYEFDFGSQPHGQNKKVENFQFKPIVNITLPDKWFVSLWDSTDFVYQKDGGPNDGKWNIPVDVMIGKRSGDCLGISDKCVYSFQYIDTIVEDYKTQEWSTQLRAGFFF